MRGGGQEGGGGEKRNAGVKEGFYGMREKTGGSGISKEVGTGRIRQKKVLSKHCFISFQQNKRGKTTEEAETGSTRYGKRKGKTSGKA